jgi:hypothetical protein
MYYLERGALVEINIGTVRYTHFLNFK